ncbi:unnamed protein product [Microthlaspi erraticum]|uniref:Uncharacterized protein n=1 Tax=Microthlaspi erraticum TaxID=1685480 RepID=A0A6D2I917_9BRAS|nr:unnamed protein product [Microthlaspi erraticum]
MEMENPLKEAFVFPNEQEFADAIVYRIQHQSLVMKPVLRPKTCSIIFLRRVYRRNVWSLYLTFADKLRRGKGEFPSTGLPCHVYNAIDAMHQTANGFVQLMRKEDCDSLDKFKSLLVSAFGCMFTLAMKVMPTLTYFQDARQANRRERMRNSEDYDDVAASTLIDTRYLAHQRCAEEFPLTVDVDNVANFVDPNVMRWLEELEREHGFRFKEPHCAKLSLNPKWKGLARCTNAKASKT